MLGDPSVSITAAWSMPTLISRCTVPTVTFSASGGGGGFDSGSALWALDIKTGAAKWKHEHAQGRGGMSGGILTTAGRLLFTGDSGELVAFDPANGKQLWHQRLPQPVSNGPSSWMLDGKQYLIVDVSTPSRPAEMWAFTLPSGK